jgi:hypothetical protein
MILTLVAQWTLKQDPAVDMPIRVFWENGRSATQQDYLEHRLDTHELVAYF